MKRAFDTSKIFYGLALLAAGVVLYAIGGIALWQGAKRLGGVGLFLYVVVMIAWLMCCSPFLHSGLRSINSGSRKAQNALAKRQAEQRAHFGLVAGLDDEAKQQRRSKS